MKGGVPPSFRSSPRKRVAGRLRRVAAYGAGGRRNPAAFAAGARPPHWGGTSPPRGGGRRGLDCRRCGARRWAGVRLRRVAARRPPVVPAARPVPRRGASVIPPSLRPVPLLAFRCGRPGYAKTPGGCPRRPVAAAYLCRCQKSFLCYPSRRGASVIPPSLRPVPLLAFRCGRPGYAKTLGGCPRRPVAAAVLPCCQEKFPLLSVVAAICGAAVPGISNRGLLNIIRY